MMVDLSISICGSGRQCRWQVKFKIYHPVQNTPQNSEHESPQTVHRMAAGVYERIYRRQRRCGSCVIILEATQVLHELFTGEALIVLVNILSISCEDRQIIENCTEV